MLLSIPARAGEPLRCKAFIERLGVLSPRVRGNPLAYFPAVGNLAPV